MPTIKAVIDTSVMLSVAFPKAGLAKELRDMIADGAFYSGYFKGDYGRALPDNPLSPDSETVQAFKEDIDEFIGMVMEKSLITREHYKLDKIADDPTDDMFLACAMEAKADYIVSRDPHLRNLKHFHGIRIIDVKAFVERLRKG